MVTGEVVVGRIATADGEKDLLSGRLASLDVWTDGRAVGKEIRRHIVVQVGL